MPVPWGPTGDVLSPASRPAADVPLSASRPAADVRVD